MRDNHNVADVTFAVGTTPSYSGAYVGLFPMGFNDGSVIWTRYFHVGYPSDIPTTGGTISVSHTGSDLADDVTINDPSGGTIIRLEESYWTISTGGGLTGGTYDLGVSGTGFGLISDVSQLRLTINAANDIAVKGANGGITSWPYVDRTGLSLAQLNNSFYIGSINMSSPLPIELLFFKATCENSKTNLTWATASETNNDYHRTQQGWANMGNSCCNARGRQ